MTIRLPNVLGFWRKPKATLTTLNKKIRGELDAADKTLLDLGGVQGDEVYSLEGAGLAHLFGHGVYVRECRLPAGMLLTTKIHKKDHPYFVLEGKARVLDEAGVHEVTAPCYGMTKAGTKRLILVLEDLLWVTVHGTRKKTLEAIEKDVIAKGFNELDFPEEDFDKLTEGVK